MLLLLSLMFHHLRTSFTVVDLARKSLVNHKSRVDEVSPKLDNFAAAGMN